MTHSSAVPVIELKSIVFAYPGADNPVLDGVDLTIMPGESIGIIAPNGSGKTTLFHTIMGLCRPDSGTVTILGKPMEKEADFVDIRLKVGLLFQDADDQLFSPTVLDDIAFGPLNQGLSRDEALSQARRTLVELGIEKLENCITHKLSGGQKRLVALASVLAMRPKILLLDEPTSGLDTSVRELLIMTLNRLSITMLIISHDYDFLAETTTRLVSMENGRILHGEELHIHRHEHVHRHGRLPHRHDD